jgi:hypothetical protein
VVETRLQRTALVGRRVRGLPRFAGARAQAALPADHAVHCMVAVGPPGRREDLPEPYRSRGEPNDRRPVSSLAFEAHFPT